VKNNNEPKIVFHKNEQIIVEITLHNQVFYILPTLRNTLRKLFSHLMHHHLDQFMITKFNQVALLHVISVSKILEF
jgi:hypothetical protein